MADIENLKRLAEKAYEAAPFPDMKKLGAAHRKFYAKAGPEVVLALIAESKEQAERLRMYEMIHGGRASELAYEVSTLRAEVRRLKIAAGEDVPPLPEEFVGPMPENCYARLRRKLRNLNDAPKVPASLVFPPIEEQSNG